MPITQHIEEVARRTIDEIQDYYKRFSDDINDTDEMEHRIARVERLKEACNGLTEKDKLQKTAENLFEVGTAWERGQDMIKKIIRKNQKNVETKLAEFRKENNENYEKIQSSIKELSENMNKKFEKEKQYNETRFETKVQQMVKDANNSDKIEGIGFKNSLLKFFDKHFGVIATVVIILIIVIFASGQMDMVKELLGIGKI